MCDGAASLMSMFFDMAAAGRWTEGRESNFLDGGAHFYGVYECACGNFISIGSIEPQFYALLRQHAGLSGAEFDAQMDRNEVAAGAFIDAVEVRAAVVAVLSPERELL